MLPGTYQVILLEVLKELERYRHWYYKSITVPVVLVPVCVQHEGYYQQTATGRSASLTGQWARVVFLEKLFRPKKHLGLLSSTHLATRPRHHRNSTRRSNLLHSNRDSDPGTALTAVRAHKYRYVSHHMSTDHQDEVTRGRGA